ncbi:MAG: VWA domain-containing protein [Actinobacteria bacterium]|nr:VWA domain-containing protein [Actinomycetota bacterium]
MGFKGKVTFSVFVTLVSIFSPWVLSTELRADSVSRDNIDIYVLVDESTSLSQKDVQLEREAVQSIVSLQTIKKRGIRVGVVPFSSGKSSPRAIEGCDLVPVDDGNDLLLVECAKKITRQFSDAGNTDFAGAFNFVADAVGDSNEKDRVPVIILLTDGIYDPDGNEITSDEEVKSLDDAIARLSELKIPIWALGFGQANLEALTRYSEATRRESLNCDADANARTVETDSIAIQLKVIVGEATCSDVSAPEPIPSKRFVHPLIDTVVVTVSTKNSDPPTLTSPTGESLCANDFREISERVFQCTVSEDGKDPGIWTVDAAAGSLVTWEFFGNVLLDFDSCPEPTGIRLSRIDGNPVQFDSADLWPSVEVSLDGSRKGDLILDAEVVSLGSVISNVPNSGILTAEAITGSRRNGLPRLNVKIASCDLAAPPAPSTTVPPTTTIPAPPPPSCEELDNCPPPLWPWIVLAVLSIAGGFLALRWRRSRIFPAGTILTQKSPVNERAWIEPAGELGSDIGETKRVAIVVDRASKKISANNYGGACDYVISVSRGQVLINSSQESADEEDQDSAVTQTSSRIEPFGIDIELEQGVVIRVERPDSDELVENE